MSTTIAAAKCAHCNKAFTPARRDALTCSKLCRQRRWRDQRAMERAALEVETMQLVAKCRAAVRDGSTLDGLAPLGVQTLIPTAEETRTREDAAAEALERHGIGGSSIYPDRRISCRGCDWEGDWEPDGSSMRRHQAEKVVEALACL